MKVWFHDNRERGNNTMMCAEFSRRICDNCSSDYSVRHITQQHESTKRFLEIMDASIKYHNICPNCLDIEHKKIEQNTIGPIFRSCLEKRLPLTVKQIQEGINRNMTYDEYRSEQAQ